jgi:hypothetical protein
MNRSLRINLKAILRGTAVKRGAIFGAILIAALLAFELFNYSTTAFALGDVLGDLQTAGVRWSTILALAFCGIDFAGIARLFTPQRGRQEPTETWYLFGAWLLAASFNAMLTWWGVSVAILNHTAAGSILVGQATVTRVVPVIVAVMVWMIRVLIIGTFSMAGENMFSMAEARPASFSGMPSPARGQPAASYAPPAPRPMPAMRPLPHAAVAASKASLADPTYHPLGMNAQPAEENLALRH